MNKLTVVLQWLVELHVTLLDTAKKKQQILISGEITPLLAVLSEESRLIKKIKEADTSRTAVVEQMAPHHSLSELIDRQPDGDEKAEWTSIRNRLQHLFQEIEQVNQANQQLLQQSLTYTQHMIEQMLPVSEGSGLYSPGSASKESSDSVRLFDAKA